MLSGKDGIMITFLSLHKLQNSLIKNGEVRNVLKPIIMVTTYYFADDNNLTHSHSIEKQLYKSWLTKN